MLLSNCFLWVFFRERESTAIGPPSAEETRVRAPHNVAQIFTAHLGGSDATSKHRNAAPELMSNKFPRQ